MKKHLLINGHGAGDVGAVGNGTNERDFTRNAFTPLVAKYINATKGHSAVVYNRDYNMYAQTARGGGMYNFNSRSYATMTEFHLDAFNGTARYGHVIYASGLTPDTIDRGIANAIKKYVGVRHGGLNARNNLLQVNVARQKGINYRLVELGFIDNASDMANIRRNIDAYAKEVAAAITGKQATEPKKSSPVKKAVSAVKKVVTKKKTPYTVGSWKTDSKGTQYIQAHGTLVVTAKKGITARFGSPFRSSPHGGVAKKGWKHAYDMLARQDGHLWARYWLKGKIKWLPVNTWNSKTGEVSKKPWVKFK